MKTPFTLSEKIIASILFVIGVFLSYQAIEGYIYINLFFLIGVCLQNKKSNRIFDCFFLLVVSPGFEPRQAEPKTAVLPLHHETNSCFF